MAGDMLRDGSAQDRAGDGPENEEPQANVLRLEERSGLQLERQDTQERAEEKRAAAGKLQT
jgi:hypothetical protein